MSDFDETMIEQTNELFNAIFNDAPVRTAPEPSKEFVPTAEHLIGVIAADYGVTHDMAAKWLRDAFAPVPNSVQESL